MTLHCGRLLVLLLLKERAAYVLVATANGSKGHHRRCQKCRVSVQVKR
ncbi:hypothetical protein KCP71_25255 [Salmonella enterica subsp. enterica]|nr:hypothetical protein KCP71_25255 [Salmonella enterica subsp. enterica]